MPNHHIREHMEREGAVGKGRWGRGGGAGRLGGTYVKQHVQDDVEDPQDGEDGGEEAS
jgi:hypothetical protein